MIYGKYQLIERIGTGGMAEVYKAKSYGVEGFEKLLVIKRILPIYNDNEDFVEMFINEAKIAVSLTHANVVQIFDLGKVGDSFYIAMEYVQGIDLAHLLSTCRRRQIPLPMELSVFIAMEVAKGLDYAHRKRDAELNSQNIIHRDVSPPNILISTEGEVKITDFGIARAIDRLGVDERTPIQGKFAYMAPEQAIGAPHDHRVDIFSLGIVLYEMLTGSRPFVGERPTDIVKAIQERNYPEPLLRRDGHSTPIPTPLRDIINRTLSPDPADRFSTAAELYEELLSYFHTTGLRNATHQLAEFVAPLEPFTENSPEPSLVGISRVSSIHEDPLNITSVGGPSRDELSRLTDGGVHQLKNLQKDVFLICISFQTLPDKAILDILTRQITENGGILLEEIETDVVFGFGVRPEPGPSQMAADAAYRCLHDGSARTEYRQFRTFGIGLTHASLRVETDGTVKMTPVYMNALQQVQALAAPRDNRILVSEAVGSIIAEDFALQSTVPVRGIPTRELLEPAPREQRYRKLAGRIGELRQIGALLAEVNRPETRVLMISGRSGIGKTRIMHEVKRRLSVGGHQVQWIETACTPLTRRRPFAVVIDLLEQMLNALSSSSSPPPGLSDREHRAITLLLEGNIPTSEKFESLRTAVLRLLAETCARGLTVLFVDNLSAVDDPSLAILHHLSQAARNLPLLLSGTIRSGYIHGFETSSCFTEIEVPLLSPEELTAFVRTAIQSSPPPELLTALMRLCDGIPAHVEHYLQAFTANDALTLRAGNAIFDASRIPEIPPLAVRERIGSEFFSLPADRRTIIQYASVLGEQFEVALLAHLIDKPIEELQPVLKMLGRVHLLRPEGSDFSFSCSAVRNTIYYEIDEEDRKQIHLQITKSIHALFPDDTPGRAAQLASHLWRGPSRRQALSYLLDAAEESASVADFEQSTRRLFDTLELVSSPGREDPAQMVSLLGQVIPYAVHTPMLPDVLQICQTALNIAGIRDNPALCCATNLNCSHVHLHMGNAAEALKALASAEASAAASGETHLICAALQTLGQIHLQTGQLIHAMEPLSRALDQTPMSDTAHRENREALLTYARVLSGEAVSADLFRTSLHRLQHTNIGEIGSALFYLRRGLCALHRMNGDVSAALAIANDALQEARTAGLRKDMTVLLTDTAELHLSQREWRKAFSLFRESEELANRIGHRDLVSLNRVGRSCIDAITFGSTEARNHLDRVTEQDDTVPVRIAACLYAGMVALSAGQPGLARPSLQRGLHLSDRWHYQFYRRQIETLLTDI